MEHGLHKSAIPNMQQLLSDDNEEKKVINENENLMNHFFKTKEKNFILVWITCVPIVSSELSVL